MNWKFDAEELVNHLKASGFVYQGSEIYGGLANTWDYGPLGAMLKNNLKKLWIKEFIDSEFNNVLLDSSILSNTNIWKASGHLSNFSDPLIDCKECKTRYRADKLLSQFDVNEKTTNEEFQNLIKVNNIKCPNCHKNNWTDVRNFNLMFKTHQGPVADEGSEIYLRPETAQGIFVNFKNIQRSMRLKLPFAVGQIGKAFRNEITPGNFIFRTREFEQMELEVFCFPGNDEEVFNHYLKKIELFLTKTLGIAKESIHLKKHSKLELSHYSKATTDFEFDFLHGRSELWGIANRTDFDLKSHQKHSGVDLSYLDPETNQKIIPYVIEPSVGVERLLFAILTNAYKKEILENEEERIVLKLPISIAPYIISVLPLSNKLNEDALKIHKELKVQGFSTSFDTSGSIGKRYRRHDSIGTPFCLTVDFNTHEDHCVTIRHRDSMKQERIKISEVGTWLKTFIK